MLTQHSFKRKIEITRALPRILVAAQALQDMWYIVEQASQEVGWLGTVQQNGNDLLIDEIFLFEQRAHGTTCEISTDGLAAWAQEMLETRPDADDVINRLRFWGHSHVNMGTSPSGQDESQMSIFADSCSDFFIRAIANKSGRLEFTLFLYEKGLAIKDCPWSVSAPADEERREKWKKELEEKVKTFYVPIPQTAPGTASAYSFLHEEDEDEDGFPDLKRFMGFTRGGRPVKGSHLPKPRMPRKKVKKRGPCNGH